MKIKRWFSDGHPLGYHVMALVFALVALGSAVTTTIFAEDTLSGAQTNLLNTTTQSSVTSTTTTTVDPVACTYGYSNWGACEPDSKRRRTVTSTTPSGCVQESTPRVVESCNYTAPAPTNTITAPTAADAPQCNYTYSDWRACQSNSKQIRSLVSQTPSGCEDYIKPILEQSCTYTAPAADQCLYSYSSWGACQSNEKRTRSLISKSPTSCEEYTKPVLEQSCIFDTTSSSISPAPTATVPITTTTAAPSSTALNTGDVTPPFSFVSPKEGMTISGDFDIRGEVAGAQAVEYYLIPVGSNTHKYIGSGNKISGNIWSFNFRSRNFPNGEFYLRVKIKNMYGEYGSGQRKISIANNNSTLSTTGFTTIENAEEKAKILQSIEEELQIPKDESRDTAALNLEDQKKYIFNYCQSNPTKCFPDRDSDKDGLSDIDEIRYGTNPKGADSDLDGFIDGDEVKSGFDPVKYSPGDQSDRIVFEDPKKAGEVKEKIYVVNKVELKEAGEGKKKMQLQGKGLPNSFVTLYVYSDPIVLTVKTDSEGNWTYELDKELENGEHEAYVAITDNTGKITAKSEPFAFVKTAQAVTAVSVAQAAPSVPPTLPVTQTRTQKDFFYLISIIIAALAVALATIGLIKHRRSIA